MFTSSNIGSEVSVVIQNLVILKVKVKSASTDSGRANGSSVLALISGFCSMKRVVRVFLFPLDGILVHCKLV